MFDEPKLIMSEQESVPSRFLVRQGPDVGRASLGCTGIGPRDARWRRARRADRRLLLSQTSPPGYGDPTGISPSIGRGDGRRSPNIGRGERRCFFDFNDAVACA
jgi:hypothetical protein